MTGRLGLLGGTFDPPHIGHLVAAVHSRSQLRLDHVVVVPAGDPWQKSGARDVTPAEVRLEMVRAACEGLEGVVVSDVEVRRQGPSYMIDTVEELTAAGERAVLLLGADAAAGLPTWHRAEELATRVDVAWFDRPGSPAPELAPEWRLCHLALPHLDVSSTQLREWAASGRPLDVLVPAEVVSIVRRRGLYRGSR